MERPLAIIETSLYVDNLQAAKNFYQDVVLLELHSEREQRHVFFRCGSGMLLLFDAERTNDEHSSLPRHGTRSNSHIAFSVIEEELEEWRAHLARKGISIEREHQWPSGGRSIYFRDPSGNSLEITTPKTWAV